MEQGSTENRNGNVSETIQCSAEVFKRAGREFSKRAFPVQCSITKKALTTVISAFYRHFYDCFCDSHFDNILFYLPYINWFCVREKIYIFRLVP